MGGKLAPLRDITAILLAMRHSAGGAVVASGQDSPVTLDHRAHGTATASRPRAHGLGNLHEVLVPCGALSHIPIMTRPSDEPSRLGAMRDWWRRLGPGFVAALLYGLVRLWGLTIRLSARGEEALNANPGKGKIVAGWHGRSFLAPLRWRNRGWFVLVSQSRDGEIATRVWQKLGFNVLRGSTGVDKGGARAAAMCAKALKAGATLIFSPDGSKGPAQILQKGVLWIAQNGEAEIIPATTNARPRKLLRSWDRYLLPLPFSRGVVALGDPITVPKGISDEEMERIRCHVERKLTDLQDEVEREMWG
jgi:lysophospholipid acyltransferase (LPLAT)-like uncharacterized protein